MREQGADRSSESRVVAGTVRPLATAGSGGGTALFFPKRGNQKAMGPWQRLSTSSRPCFGASGVGKVWRGGVLYPPRGFVTCFLPLCLGSVSEMIAVGLKTVASLPPFLFSLH